MKRDVLFELVAYLLGILWFGAVTAFCFKLIFFTAIHIFLKALLLLFMGASAIFLTIFVVFGVRFIIERFKKK